MIQVSEIPVKWVSLSLSLSLSLVRSLSLALSVSLAESRDDSALHLSAAELLDQGCSLLPPAVLLA